MWRIAIVVLATFAAGFGLGYTFGPRPEARGPSRRETLPSSPQARGPALETEAAEPQRPLQAALASIPVAEPPQGNGTIVGHVRTPAGEPVAGVLVVATPRYQAPRRKYRRGLGAPEEPDLEEWVSRVVAGRKWSWTARREARTDSMGAYEITGLAEAEYRLKAYLEGFRVDPARGHDSYNVRPRSTVEFVAWPLLGLSVDVLTPEGSRPPRATIHCRGDAKQDELWLPEEPWIELRPGSYTLRASAEGGFASKEQNLVVEESGATPALVFQLERLPGIEGRIHFPSGVLARPIAVYALRFTGSKPPSDERLVGEGTKKETDGRTYQYEGLKPGSYLVGTGYGTRSVAVRAVVRVDTATVDQPLNLPEPDPAQFVVLHVFGPDGIRLSDVRVETRYRGGSFGATGGGRFFRRDDGALLVPHHSWDKLRFGSEHTDAKWFVEVISDEFGSISREYVPVEDEELTIRFLPGARLTVRIAGYVDSGHEGKVQVYLKARGAPDPYFGSTRHDRKPDSDGRQILGPDQPGAYEAILVLRPGTLHAKAIARLPLQLRAGENDALIPLPGLHKLTVISQPGLRAHVTAAGDRHGLRSLRRNIGKDGKAVFEHLPAGTYTVGVWGNGVSEVVTVEIPAQTVVRLR